MNLKAEKLYIRFLIDGLRCPVCNSKFRIIPGTIDKKPAHVLECQKKHTWKASSQLEALELNQQKELVAASG